MSGQLERSNRKLEMRKERLDIPMIDVLVTPGGNRGGGGGGVL